MKKKCFPSCTADPKIGRTCPGASASRLKRRHPLGASDGPGTQFRGHIICFTHTYMCLATCYQVALPSESNSEGERSESAKGPMGPFAEQQSMIAGRGQKPRPENISKHVIVMITCFDNILNQPSSLINELEPFHGSSSRLQELSFGSVLANAFYWLLPRNLVLVQVLKA